MGRKCIFNSEFVFSAREYGTLLVDDKNVAVQIVEAGLAKVIEKKGSMPASSNYEELSQA